MGHRNKTSLYIQLFVASVLCTAVGKAILPRLYQAQSLRSLLFHGLALAILGFVLDRLILYPYFRSRFASRFPKLYNDKLWCFSQVIDSMLDRGKTALTWFEQFSGEDAIHVYDPVLGDIVMPISPRALRDGLTSNYQDYGKPPGLNELYATVGGESLIFTNGEKYAKFRKAIHPLFSPRIAQKTHDISWRQSEVLMTAIYERGMQKGFHDPWPLLFRYVLDSVGEGLLSHRFQSMGSAWNNSYVKMLQRVFTPTRYSDIFSAASLFMPRGYLLSLPVRQIRSLKEVSTRLRDLGSQILESAQSFNHRSDPQPEELLRLLAAKGRLNDEEMVETILTFLAAGVETTSAALTWTLHLLTLPENVKYQARLRQEIRNKLPKDGCHSITHRDLQTLPLLHGIIEESLRLHPPVPLIPYNAVRDTEMAGQFVPAGTKVVYWAWALNRNPDQWGSDAECMNPYRWISTDELGIERPNKHGGALSHYSHETFLQGPRGCVGKETSKATLRAAVAKLILGFDVSRDPTGTLAPPSRGAAVVRPIKSLKLNFSPVDVSGG